MAQPRNKNCCYVCDTLLTSNSEDEPLGIQFEVQTSLISTVKKYLPTINKYQFDLICQSCLHYITYFNEMRTKWEDNECIIKQKRELGQFKGLKDIVKLKKTSSHICRLCFKETIIQEATFVYHEDQIYLTGYVQKMITSHSPHTDLSLTENPIICLECLDTLQTFDAFHQMWLQAQSTKDQDFDQVDRKIQNYRNSKVDTSENNVHVQLRKTSANTVTIRTLTQAESAVSSLPNVKDLLEKKSNNIITAWASENFLDLINKQNSKDNNGNKIENDVCVISATGSSVGRSTDDKILYNTLCPAQKNNTSNENIKISESTPEIIISDDEDEYCKWFPYEHILDKSQRKVFNKTKKVDATVLENRSGERLFRCNNCLFAVKKESDLFCHGCVKGKGKKWFYCKAKKCNFSTHKKILLSQHELFHKLDESYWQKCYFCDFHATEENLIVHHHKQSHQMGIVQRNSKCPQCFFESDIPDILSHHISARHGPDKGKQQNNNCNNQRRNNIFESNLKSLRKYYRCNYCRYGSFRRVQLITHSRYKHSNDQIQ